MPREGAQIKALAQQQCVNGAHTKKSAGFCFKRSA